MLCLALALVPMERHMRVSEIERTHADSYIILPDNKSLIKKLRMLTLYGHYNPIRLQVG